MTAATVFRDYVTDGVPASGAHKPRKSEVRAWGFVLEAGLGALDIVGANSKITIDATDNNIHIGDNVRPTPAAGAGILYGIGTTAVGSEILVSASNNATYCTFMGDLTANGANNLYCCEGFGIRVFNELADGQYVAGFGTDIGFHLGYGRNSALLGAKAGLYKVDIRDSTILGVAAGYAGGDVLQSIIIGANACDAGQPGSFATANADHHDVSYSVVIGAYAGRYLKGAYNVLIGNNAGSISTITGQFNMGLGRSTLPALTSGTGNVAVGDSAGGVVTTGNYNVFIGYQVEMPAGGAAYANCVALGYQSGASLTGSNQVQLGSTAHTVYAQSSLSVRSDKRDKIDESQVSIDLAREIVLGANWLTYRMDPRDAYFDTVQEEVEIDDFELVEVATGKKDKSGWWITTTQRKPIKRKELRARTIPVERDGSRAGKRRHAGVFAQDEYARLADKGIDFAGIKHAAVSGGADVWSTQYEQYIPYMGAILQELASRVERLEGSTK